MSLLGRLQPLIAKRRASPPAPTVPVTADRYELVVVSYHSKDHVAGLLEAAAPEQRIVVVDNASGADGVAEVVRRFEHGRYLDGRDSGFAVAANLGAFSSTADYVIFANPDSRPTSSIWQALVAELEADPLLASVAASTTEADGRIEMGVGGWEPTVLRCLVYSLGLHTLLPHAGVYARPQVGERVELGWLTGACMAVRRSAFVELGGFDERYFVYNEDMAFGRRVREAGLRQKLRTDLLVRHSTGGSGGGSTKMPQQRGASMAAYLHHHNRAPVAVAMRLILALGILARAAAAHLQHRRDLVAPHLAYVRGLATSRSPFRP